MDQHFILKLHFSSTLYMVGVICFIQYIHYPLFSLVGKDQFIHYHAKHIELTSVVIAIPMLVECLTMFYLLAFTPALRVDKFFILSAVLLLIIWMVTFIISVPQHNILGQGFEQKAFHTLVSTNWIRTIAWVARAVILFKFI
ncbi:MAG: hypothetical protein H7281_06620 [Bacteriovorax sp.]|nr:hypothetical protein [Bacteriovorax sp.]